MDAYAYDEWQRKANEEVKDHPGNADAYDVSLVIPDRQHPLRGKSVVFLGSSVTVGAFSRGQACADYLARKCGLLILKEAVSGTTLANDEHDGSSYVERLHTIPASAHVDALVCQLSTNDAWKGKSMGAIVEEGPYDTTTVAGAMQHVVDYARTTWGCPVLFYSGTHFESDVYAQMVELLDELSEVMDVVVIDLYHDEAMRAVSPEDVALYMHDPVHPTKAGYELWWTPKFEEALMRVFA
jgi:lysophospholipase L1-like esterase